MPPVITPPEEPPFQLLPRRPRWQPSRIALGLGLCAVTVAIIGGGVALYAINRVDANMARAEKIVTGATGLVDTAKQVDVEKVREKSGELTDKATEKARDAIRTLRDEWKR